MSLRHSAAETHMHLVRKSLREAEDSIDAEIISDYLLGINEPGIRRNYLSAFNRFFRGFLKTNLVDDFKRPTPNDNPTPCPSDEAVRTVFCELEYLRQVSILANSDIRVT